MQINKNIPANVMIVEDEKDLCFLLERIVRTENLLTSSVNYLSEARYVIKKIKPNILILDNHLPDGSGIDFISEVKKLSPSTKIIMITAHDSQYEVERAFIKGADHFISKPFNTSTIQTMLTNILFELTV